MHGQTAQVDYFGGETLVDEYGHYRSFFDDTFPFRAVSVL